MFFELLEYNGKQYFNLTDKDALSLGIPDSVVNSAVNEQQLNQAIERRRTAYVTESDPLYMEWKFDQTPEKEQEWRDKV
ncbi:hypothetical protein EAY74_22515, partial [Vibrio anguillarum]